MPHSTNQRPGAITTILVLAITGIAISAFVSLSVLSTSQLGQAAEVERADQTFFAAESGLNVGLERIRESSFPTVAPFVMNNATVTVTVDLDPTNPYGRIITSHAEHTNGQERTLQIKVTTSTFAVGLSYAVQAGVGGLTMDNGATVYGNVHANGSVLPADPGDIGTFRASDVDPVNFPGDLTVAGTSHIIEQMNIIDGDAWAETLKGRNGRLTTVNGIAKYQIIDGVVEAGGVPCQTGVVTSFCQANSTVPTEKPLPIGDAEIATWTSQVESAATGQTLGGNQTISGNVTWPSTKVNGSLSFDNNAHLTVTGALWVTGNIQIANNGRLTLSSNALVNGTLTLINGTTIELNPSLGSDDGVVIVDNTIRVENGVTLRGSGNPASSLTLLTKSTSLDPSTPAIQASNQSDGVIYYAKDGVIRVSETGDLNSVMAHTVFVESNATVRFLPALQFFSIPDPDPDPIGVQTGSWQDL